MSAQREAKADGVPPEIAPYIRALGPDRTGDLITALGGSMLYFARKASSRSTAAAIVGADGVQALSREFGTGMFRVPIARAWLVCHLFGRGVSVQEIARRLHMTDVTVRKYLKRRKAGGQLDLFDD
ncbi:MAG TPA: hypothetical protein VLA00_14665 [Xanthobacteraceae bacterium]|nr:hypothetical protein [Xanthobacteraceae bacterium]